MVSSTFSVILLTLKDKSYSRNMCILFCRPIQTRKYFQVVPSWYLLLDPAALNENITFQLRSFHLKITHKTFTLRAMNCQAYVFILYGRLVGPDHVASLKYLHRFWKPKYLEISYQI